MKVIKSKICMLNTFIHNVFQLRLSVILDITRCKIVNQISKNVLNSTATFFWWKFAIYHNLQLKYECLLILTIYKRLFSHHAMFHFIALFNRLKKCNNVNQIIKNVLNSTATFIHFAIYHNLRLKCECPVNLDVSP